MGGIKKYFRETKDGTRKSRVNTQLHCSMEKTSEPTDICQRGSSIYRGTKLINGANQGAVKEFSKKGD